jgi:hypothetical protein
MVDIDTSGAEVLHQVLSGLADRGVPVGISCAIGREINLRKARRTLRSARVIALITTGQIEGNRI